LPQLVVRIVVALVPVAALMFVVPSYGSTWYFYDEWSMITRILDTPDLLRAAFEPYNGHLYAVCYFVYRLQVNIGLNGHALIWAVFCLSLLACNVAVALVLWKSGVQPLVAVIAGAVVTYLGPAAQLSTFEILFTWDGAIALSFFAAYLAIRRRQGKHARTAIAVAALLVLAIGFDSASAYGGLLFVAVLVGLRWRDRWVLLALGPPLFAAAVFQLRGGGSLGQSVSVSREIVFFLRLILRSVGALVGGGEAAGAVAIVLAAAALVWGFLRGMLSGTPSHLLIAGSLAAVALAGSVAVTRAGVVGHDFWDFNRYIGLVGVYFLAALLPPLVATCEGFLARSRSGAVGTRWFAPTLALLLIVVFLLNLSPFTKYRSVLEGWQQETHTLVAQVSSIVARGCGDGRHVIADAEPLGSLDPQISVALVSQLEEVKHLKLAGSARSELLTYPVAAATLESLRASMCVR
jgi:hypothetical protein